MSPAFNVATRTYCGPLSNYHYNNSEIGDLWSWIRAVRSKEKIYFIDNLWWDAELPQDTYDCYVIGVFGEFANTRFLEQLDQRCANVPGYVLTSINIDSARYKNLKILSYEHLQQYKMFFPKTPYDPLSVRTNMHSILTRRVDFHKTIFTAALLNKCPELEYSFCFVGSGQFNQEHFDKNYRDYVNIDTSEFSKEISQLLTQGPKVFSDVGQWSIDIPAYKNTILHWVNEAIFLSIDANPTGYLTEKIIKPIVSGTPFVLLSQKHSYKRLKALGFNVYDEMFDLSWDDADDIDRANGILKLMNTCKHGIDITVAQKIADYNYNHFYNGLEPVTEQINSYSRELLLEELS